MGSLKPGATYIYERDGGVVYAREFGADPSTRQVHGWDFDPEEAKRFDPRIAATADLADHNEWIKIRLAGKTNPTLQTAIDRVKLLYKLSIEKYE
jgi:hypothetical protein